ncbi:MAG: hypothetical protein KDD50_10370 [Bdellovibrionales bacterium]|nr:hypothetical protein [Bdellovibrionales bacterium]
MKINQFLPSERPRERCIQYGAETLSLRECLAVLLGTGPKNIGCFGLADQILQFTDLTKLDEASFFTTYGTDPLVRLRNVHGLGPAGQAKILVALDLCRRFSEYKSIAKHKTTAKDGLTLEVKKAIPKSMYSSPIEILGFVPYFQDGRVGQFVEIQKGEERFVSVSSQKILRSVLLCKAQGFWLFHNHPGGNDEPSTDDKSMTRNIRWLCKQLDLDFKGHWIVVGQNFVQC